MCQSVEASASPALALAAPVSQRGGVHWLLRAICKLAGQTGVYEIKGLGRMQWGSATEHG